MSDLGTTLTTLFDEVASTINPRPDFEAVLNHDLSGAPLAGGAVLGRPMWQAIGFAAVSVALLAGAVVVLHSAFDRGEGSVATGSGDQSVALFDPNVYLFDTPDASGAEGPRVPLAIAPKDVTSPASTDPPPTDPPPTEPPATTSTSSAGRVTTAPPAAVKTARTGWSDLTGDPMRQSYYGTATPNEKVTVTSPFGEASTRADHRGEWSLVLLLTNVPGGTTVPTLVTYTTSGTTFAFDVLRPPDPVATTTTTTTTTTAPPPPTTVKPVEQTPVEPTPEPTEPAPPAIAFTADLGSADLASEPMKQIFHGTGAPGSVVYAESAFGSAEAAVGSKGYWELKLKMFDVPVGTGVGVWIANSASGNVYEYWLVRQEPPPPPEIEFSANAAFTECDSPVPFNEYWGKSTAGATITISSPYGGGQVASNGDGKWSARLEFPDAPIGEVFEVTITSSKSASVFTFPMVSTRQPSA
jgi:hypothetical protein